MGYIVQVRGRRYPVETLRAASEKHAFLRDKSGRGASTFPDSKVLNAEGTEVARISYNGRAWPPGGWNPGVEPLCLDPEAATNELAHYGRNV